MTRSRRVQAAVERWDKTVNISHDDMMECIEQLEREWPRHAISVRMHIEDGEHFSDIGRALGVSCARANQIYHSGIRKLRAYCMRINAVDRDYDRMHGIVRNAVLRGECPGKNT